MRNVFEILLDAFGFGMILVVLLFGGATILRSCAVDEVSAQSVSAMAINGKADINLSLPDITVPVHDLCWREISVKPYSSRILFAYTYIPTMGSDWETTLSTKTKLLGLEIDKDKTVLMDYRITGQRFELLYPTGPITFLIGAEQWGSKLSVTSDKDFADTSMRSWLYGGGCRVILPLTQMVSVGGKVLQFWAPNTKTLSADVSLSIPVSSYLSFGLGLGLRQFHSSIDDLSIDVQTQGLLLSMAARW